jgi:hypothetical protein
MRQSVCHTMDYFCRLAIIRFTWRRFKARCCPFKKAVYFFLPELFLLHLLVLAEEFLPTAIYRTFIDSAHPEQ